MKINLHTAKDASTPSNLCWTCCTQCARYILKFLAQALNLSAKETIHPLSGQSITVHYLEGPTQYKPATQPVPQVFSLHTGGNRDG